MINETSKRWRSEGGGRDAGRHRAEGWGRGGVGACWAACLPRSSVPCGVPQTDPRGLSEHETVLAHMNRSLT